MSAQKKRVNSRLIKYALLSFIIFTPQYSQSAGLLDGLLKEIAKGIPDGTQQPSDNTSTQPAPFPGDATECRTNSQYMVYVNNNAIRPNPGQLIEISLDSRAARSTMRISGIDGVLKKVYGDKVCKIRRGREVDSNECIALSPNSKRIDNTYIKPMIAGKLFVQSFPVDDATIFLTYANTENTENHFLKFKVKISRLLKEDNDNHADNCQYLSEFMGFSDETTSIFIKSKSDELNAKKAKDDAEKIQNDARRKIRLQQLIQQVSSKTKIPTDFLAAPITVQIGNRTGLVFVEYLNAILKDKDATVFFETSGKQYIVRQKITDRLKGSTVHIDYLFTGETHTDKDGKVDKGVLLERFVLDGKEFTPYQIPIAFAGMVSRYADTLRETAGN